MPNLFTARTFILVSMLTAFLFMFNAFQWKPQEVEDTSVQLRQALSLYHEDLIYILHWTPTADAPMSWITNGRSAFLKKQCEYTNCYVTDDKDYFIDQTDFDAILFHGKNFFHNYRDKNLLPKKRSKSQKYVFVTMESAQNYPACSGMYDSFFNWTWTYRLDSDARLGYVTVYSKSGEMVGPKEDMHWEVNDAPLNESVKEKLSSKSKAAAWFVSNCHSMSGREDYAKQLKVELKKYDLDLDVYGACGDMECPRSDYRRCYKKLQTDYFFYLSFENSFAKDYVTEKLYNALDNYVVPVVYGGANYSRFLPPNSYLDARQLGVTKLAEVMNAVIKDKTKETYYNFFKWRHYYDYKLTSCQDVCHICALLNDKKRFESVSVYEDFRKWWNPDTYRCK